LLKELDPQVKALLEQFQANAAQHPGPSTPLSAKEKILATRQMMGGYASLGCPFESVSRTEDLDIPGPAGKIPVRLYVPHMEEPRPVAAPVLIYFHGGGFVAGIWMATIRCFGLWPIVLNASSFRQRTVSPRKIRTLLPMMTRGLLLPGSLTTLLKSEQTRTGSR